MFLQCHFLFYLFFSPFKKLFLNFILCWGVGFPGGATVKKTNLPVSPGDSRDVGLTLHWEGPLEKEMATHSSFAAWRIPWTEEPGGLQSMGSQIDTRLKQLSMHAGVVCLPLATGMEPPPAGLLPLTLWRKACPLPSELCVGPDGPAEVEQIAGRCWLRPDGPFLAEGGYRSFHFGPVDSLWKYYMVFP